MWEFDRREVRVDFTDGEQHIKLLTVGLLRSGKIPDRSLLRPHRSAATTALIRRIDAEQDWRRWDTNARPVPSADAPPERAVSPEAAAPVSPDRDEDAALRPRSFASLTASENT